MSEEKISLSLEGITETLEKKLYALCHERNHIPCNSRN